MRRVKELESKVRMLEAECDLYRALLKLAESALQKWKSGEYPGALNDGADDNG